jgi:hypothetical protein
LRRLVRSWESILRILGLGPLRCFIRAWGDSSRIY